ncbi:MAG: MtnX-like HAD-IB family phosphatase [Candidatus Latescibacteria bacterium]|nr:MtnX-like HAD-IB family phosphatase [Candidatus Latescibacterota bacterium]
MAGSAIRLFVDFDGTAAHDDVGDSIFEAFLLPDLLKQRWHDYIIDEWKAGKISSFECLITECEHTRVTQDELNRHLDQRTLTPGFTKTVAYCKDNGIPLTILSDGMDYYIEYILKKHGIGDVQFKSNHMYFNNGSLGVKFPYEGKGCGRCGNCKRWHIDTLRQNGETVIYVGDGYSDRYAIRDADIIFARRDLTEYCLKHAIDFHEYNDFFDILSYLENGNE